MPARTKKYGYSATDALGVLLVLVCIASPLAQAATAVLDHPILYVHGLTSCSRTWGAITCNPAVSSCTKLDPDAKNECGRDDNSDEDFTGNSTVFHYLPGSGIANLADHFGVSTEVVYHANGEIDLSSGVNHNFLEVFNAADGKGVQPIRGAQNLGDQLYQRMEEVLLEYCGDGWRGNPQCKLTLVGHSKGGIVIREMIDSHRAPADFSNPINHIERVVTLGSPHDGSEWAEPLEFISDPFVKNTKSNMEAS